MKTYELRGKAIVCSVKAKNIEDAKRIISSPIIEVMELLKGVTFKRL